jgi:acetylornithine deacetylase/succinyl-diaminopimelate desuccinylase-like protein
MPSLQVEEKWKQKLWNIVDERRPLGIELLREAIRRPTDNPPGTTTELASFYRVNLERQNIRVEVLEPKAGCTNIIASIVGSENSRHLGHKPTRGSKEKPNFPFIPKGMIKAPASRINRIKQLCF